MQPTSGSHLPGCIDAPQPTSGPAGRTAPHRAGGDRRWVASLTHPTKRIGRTRRIGRMVTGGGLRFADPPYETNRPDAPHRADGDRRWVAPRDPPYETNRPDAPHRAGGDRRWVARALTPPYETNRPDAPHRAGGDRRWVAPAPTHPTKRIGRDAPHRAGGDRRWAALTHRRIGRAARSAVATGRLCRVGQRSATHLRRRHERGCSRR